MLTLAPVSTVDSMSASLTRNLAMLAFETSRTLTSACNVVAAGAVFALAFLLAIAAIFSRRTRNVTVESSPAICAIATAT